jgi:hypothetical protein
VTLCGPFGRIWTSQKKQHRRALSPVFDPSAGPIVPALSFGLLRNQKAPSSTAPTKTKTTQTASMFNLNARFTAWTSMSMAMSMATRSSLANRFTGTECENLPRGQNPCAADMRAKHDRAKRLIAGGKVSAAGACVVDDEIFGRGAGELRVFSIDASRYSPPKSTAFGPGTGCFGIAFAYASLPVAKSA